MYQRIILAYDGSLEGRIALREGALFARMCGAKTFFLGVVPTSVGMTMAEAIHSGPGRQHIANHRAIFDEGLARLGSFGLAVSGRFVEGDPIRAISTLAREVSADLVVVGHRRQNLAERWWSGASGGYLVDHLNCSVLIARSHVDDGAFEAQLSPPRR